MRRINTAGCKGLAIIALATAGTAAAAQDVPAAQAGQPADQAAANAAPQVQERALGSPEAAPGPAVKSTPATDEADRFHLQVGVMPRFVGNYFQTEDEFNTSTTPIPKKRADIITFSASLAYDLVKNPGETLTANVRVRPNLFTNLKGADSTDLDANIVYSKGPNQITIGYFGTPKRLSSIVAGQRIYGETEGFNVEYLRSLAKRWRIRGSYQYSRETYSAFAERNLSLDQFRADVRYKLNPLFMPSVGFEYRRAYAAVDNSDYKRPALLLSVTSEVGKFAYLNLRYRYSDRTYLTNVPTDSNFGREDHRYEFNFYGTFQLGHGFSVFAFADHISNHSNSITHAFKSKDGGLGLFYQF